MSVRIGAVLLLACCAASGAGQGAVVFNNRVTGTIVAPVYGPGPGGYMALYGNGPTDTPPGTMNWAGFSRVSGTNWSAALLCAAGASAPDAALQEAAPATVFRTGSAAGFVVPATARLPNVPADAAAATVRMVVWANQGGLFTTWAAAKPQVYRGWIPAGFSEKFTVYQIGGDLNVPPNLLGLRSFNVVGMNLYPPPEVSLPQPLHQTVLEGQPIRISVGASTTPPVPLECEWYQNLGRRPENGMDLVIPSARLPDAGSYRAFVGPRESASVFYATCSACAEVEVVALPRLAFESPYHGWRPDGFHFSVTGDPRIRCAFERSTNLIDWLAFQPSTNTSRILDLIDPEARSLTVVFYRIRAELR